MNRIFVFSDGTGRTAEQALMAAMTQFPESEVEIVRKGAIRTEQDIHDLTLEVAGANGIIVHTLVSEKLRESLLQNARIHNVEAIDLMGPLLSRLSQYLDHTPKGEPGLYFALNQEYFKRIDAVQFAFTHDDGQRYYEYNLSEILLVGVSRTFKTPLSIYLANKGWFAANYPIVIGSEIPEELSQLPFGRVFGLMTQPHELSSLRLARQQYLGGATGEYSSLATVRRELAYAEMIFNSHEWPVIQVTNKPIEEIASEILAIKRCIDHPAPVGEKTRSSRGKSR
jgi:regulator of PEP synthase PpsR (kinase-PPPase family)